jgi:hypothetical protein
LALGGAHLASLNLRADFDTLAGGGGFLLQKRMI